MVSYIVLTIASSSRDFDKMKVDGDVERQEWTTLPVKNPQQGTAQGRRVKNLCVCVF